MGGIPWSRVSALHYDNTDHASVQRWCSGPFRTLESRLLALKLDKFPSSTGSIHQTIGHLHSSTGPITPQYCTRSTPVWDSFHLSTGPAPSQNRIYSPQHWTLSVFPELDHSITVLNLFYSRIESIRPSIESILFQNWTHFIPVLDPFNSNTGPISFQYWTRSVDESILSNSRAGYVPPR